MRPCDCIMDVGMCGCGEPLTKEHFKKKDNIEKKIVFSATLSRKVVLELDSIVSELDLDSRSFLVENIFKEFIQGYRGSDFDVFTEPKIDINK